MHHTATRAALTRALAHALAPAIIATAAFSTGCKARSVSRAVGDYTPVANLTDLEQDTSQLPALVYKRPGAPRFNNYTNFIVGPILIDYRDPTMEELSQETVRRIERTLISAITTELREGGYTVGTRASPGTMRMSFVISGFKASEAGGAINAAAMTAGALGGVPMLVTLSTGEVIVEGVFTDAWNRRIDAVAIDRSAGARIFNGNPLSTWADVEATFDKWAKGIRRSVDEAHRK